MPVYVAMLRGINVGGQKSIKMEGLRSSFETLGYRDARTYVQSGNIVFNSALSKDQDLSRKIGDKIFRDYGFRVTVIIRSAAEIGKIVRANPFLREEGIDLSKLHVTFLSEVPENPSLPRMDQLNPAPDRFRIIGREVYLHCPKGYGRSKLSNNAIERTLSVQATTRNWNTVNTLAKMSHERS